MNKNKYLVWLGVSAATGAVAGMLSSRGDQHKGTFIGAVLGAMAGSVAAGLYKRLAVDDYDYYSQSSPLYENPDTTDFV